MVVVLIMGILIAMAGSTYADVRNLAQNRSAQAHARNGLVTERTYYSDRAKYTDVRNETRRQAFFPYFENRNAGGFVVYARTRQDTATAMTISRQLVQRLDANIPVSELRTLEREVDLSLSSERFGKSVSASC